MYIKSGNHLTDNRPHGVHERVFGWLENPRKILQSDPQEEYLDGADYGECIAVYLKPSQMHDQDDSLHIATKYSAQKLLYYEDFYALNSVHCKRQP